MPGFTDFGSMITDLFTAAPAAAVRGADDCRLGNSKRLAAECDVYKPNLEAGLPEIVGRQVAGRCCGDAGRGVPDNRRSLFHEAKKLMAEGEIDWKAWLGTAPKRDADPADSSIGITRAA